MQSNLKAKVRWSRESEQFVVTKFWGNETEQINWTEFMPEDQLLKEQENGLEVIYYEAV